LARASTPFGQPDQRRGWPGISAFTRVFDALLPGHDAGALSEFRPALAGASSGREVFLFLAASPEKFTTWVKTPEDFAIAGEGGRDAAAQETAAAGGQDCPAHVRRPAAHLI